MVTQLFCSLLLTSIPTDEPHNAHDLLQDEAEDAVPVEQRAVPTHQEQTIN